MSKQIRFGTFARELAVHQTELSFNALVPQASRDHESAAPAPRPARLRLRPIDAYRLVRPYLSRRFFEQVNAVVPLALYMVLFQILLLGQALGDAALIAAGLMGVIIGLMLFMEGLKVGLMPLGEALGARLPSKASLPIVLTITFLLGIGVTFAEPAIGALETAGSIIDPVRAPYVHAMLGSWALELVLVVGASVGVAAVLGTIRFIKGWSLKPFIYGSIAPAMVVTIAFALDDELGKILGLAWDTGAITTGPVTVPLVLALGIGIASSVGKGTSSLEGFGIVTLASVLPVLGVAGLALVIAASTTPEEIIAAARAQALDETPAWHQRSPGFEIIMGVRAIVPLVIFLLLVLRVVLGERLKHAGTVAFGLCLCVAGMVVFNLGLTYGLSLLGTQSGNTVPAAFTRLEGVDGSPFYPRSAGIVIALAFAFVLGFGATLAEPALNALGATVETLTNGVFRKRLLLYAVSGGVAAGLALGVAKILFDLPLAWLLVVGYIVACALTWHASEEFVAVAWDSAGVTTGPVTVPLVLALGLGFGGAMDATEGFGILAMASLGPVVAVLLVGICVERALALRHRKQEVVSESEELR